MFKGLGVELAFAVSGHPEIFESARRCGQITGVGAVAIALAFGTVGVVQINELIERLLLQIEEREGRIAG